MSRLLSIEPVRVRIGDCECPGTPHTEGDHAALRPRLTARGGLLATSILNNAPTAGVQQTMTDLGMCFLEDGLLSWDLLDDDGKPVPLDLRSGALAWETLLPIANAANDIYIDSVLAPFQKATTPPSSPRGQTGGSTSPSAN